MSNQFDVFISYKSENANAVRSVAESLLAGGVHVWFAEYEIALEDFDDDGKILHSIYSSVAASAIAVIFTNDRWTKSDFCRKEMIAITDHLPASSIVEVCIPPESTPNTEFPVLSEVVDVGNRLIWDGNPEAVALFVLNKLGRAWTRERDNLRQLSKSLPSRTRMRFGVSAQLEFLSDGRNIRRDSSDGSFPAQLYLFEGEINGQTVGLLVGINPFRPAAARSVFSENGATNDRSIYRSYRQYAKNWLESQSYRPRGVHLCFWEQHSNLAITHSHVKSDGSESFWERLYVLQLADFESASIGEATFTFHINLPQGAFREFCEIASDFERIVLSTHYKPSALRAESWSGLLLRIGTYCIFPFIVSAFGFKPLSQPMKCVVLAFGGFLTADIVYSVVNYRARLVPHSWVFEKFGPAGALQFMGWLLWLGKLANSALDQSVLLILTVVAGVWAAASLPVWAVIGVALGFGGLRRLVIQRQLLSHPLIRLRTHIKYWPQLKMDGTLNEVSDDLAASLADLRMLPILSREAYGYIAISSVVIAMIVSARWNPFAGAVVAATLILLIVWRFRIEWKEETIGSPEVASLVRQFDKEPSAENARRVADAWTPKNSSINPRNLLGALQWRAHAVEYAPTSWENLLSLGEGFVTLACQEGYDGKLPLTEVQRGTLRRVAQKLAKLISERSPDSESKEKADAIEKRITDIH